MKDYVYDDVKIPGNILEYINKCSGMYGKHIESYMTDRSILDIIEINIKSPIEQVMYCTLDFVSRMNDMDDRSPTYLKFMDEEVHLGLSVIPQYKIGKYTCDFHVSYWEVKNYRDKIQAKLIAVECDGHEFHDRSEPERRREKARDRYIQSQGYMVMHYTGKQILDDPIGVSVDIISEASGIDKDDLIGNILNIMGDDGIPSIKISY